jgi:4-hydroxythreonine-4-phosphate dehydrogenase
MSADTVFVPDIASRFDAIVAMFHDQGLPPSRPRARRRRQRHAGAAVPCVLPSITAPRFDLAATAKRARAADPGSLFAAVDLAVELTARRP